MDTLFSGMERAAKNANAPLAARVRPTTLDGTMGQEDAVGPDSWLRKVGTIRFRLSCTARLVPAKPRLRASSAVQRTRVYWKYLAITGTVKRSRREIEAAESELLTAGRRTILFIDEIHRLRAQQDALLHAVGLKLLFLLEATTEALL